MLTNRQWNRQYLYLWWYNFLERNINLPGKKKTKALKMYILVDPGILEIN